MNKKTILIMNMTVLYGSKRMKNGSTGKVMVCVFFFGPYVYMEEGSNFSRRDVLQHLTYQFFSVEKCSDL